ncbi:hypothetical protein EV196_103406 [Mariniflexile fucanivorans]|uniref:Uncharacterized protein n=1 Tax=Mariniflexile fucanivorans TaxID=264023 RepID=A0A4R1RL92_9FLAO|nr:peptidase [Mariniflexile fucanivorans]TCL66985.1 hypothetical protein EV196_103406 [Mariniflexile fucanivorans]
MNSKLLVKISNAIGIISIILLIYWVFIFISIQVFGLKVFKENLTETFYFSILGILALMTGALIINIMFNLTRIAQKHNNDIPNEKKTSKKIVLSFILSFPIIFGLLFGGDFLTSKKKETLLINSAKSIVQDNYEKANKIVNYSFDKKWIAETQDILDILTKTDENFPEIQVIEQDTIDKTPILLGFRNYYSHVNDTILPSKKDYILKTTHEERDYLNKVFKELKTEIKFSANDGNYDLYYPYKKNGRIVVFYFSDYQRYGKFGS